jgi:hypothetical protein
MAEVPLSVEELEEIVTNVSRDLLSDMAVDNDIADEDMEDWTNMCVNISTLCINRYMFYFNELVNKKALAASQWMLQNQQ